MTGTSWVGAMLYRGLQSSSHGEVSKYSSINCFRRDNLNRPHIGKLSQKLTRILVMNAAIHHIQTASQELSKLRSEVLTLEERIQTAQRTLREATESLSDEEQRPVSAPRAVPVPPYRLRGFPLKTNPELCARVQQALSLETKKEAEIALGAVIDAL